MHPVLHLRGTVVPGFGRGSRELGELPLSPACVTQLG